MHQLLQKLKEGDLRTTGKSEEVVTEVLQNHKLFGTLIEGMMLEDPGIRMRASDAVEKITLKKPELLYPFKEVLINEISQINQKEVQWHLAEIFPRLELDKDEKFKILSILDSWFETSKSQIVRVFSMQAIYDLSRNDGSLKLEMLQKLKNLLKSEKGAVLSRAKKLLNNY